MYSVKCGKLCYDGSIINSPALCYDTESNCMVAIGDLDIVGFKFRELSKAQLMFSDNSPLKLVEFKTAPIDLVAELFNDIMATTGCIETQLHKFEEKLLKTYMRKE